MTSEIENLMGVNGINENRPRGAASTFGKELPRHMPERVRELWSMK